MATVSLTIRYRPLRIGFIVQRGDIPALERVAGISTLLWGDLYNPVLPVGGDRQLVEQFIKLFNVDVLFSVSDAPDAKALIDLYPFLRTPAHLGKEIFFEDWHAKKDNVAVLDTIHIIEHYWETEFRHKLPDFQSQCALVEWERDDPCAVLFAILFGHFGENDKLRDDFRSAFERGLKSRRIRIEKTSKLGHEFVEYVSPLALTTAKLRSFGGSLREPGIYVGSVDDFDDFVNFWNLRASGIEVEYLPVGNTDRFQQFVQAYVNKLDSLPSYFPGDLGAVAVWFKEGNYAHAKSTTSAFGIKKSWLFCECHPVIWNGLNVIPSQHYFNWDNVLANVDHNYGRYTVSFSLPPKPIASDQDRRDVHFQHLVAVVSPTVEFEYPDHTLKPPFIRELNEFLSREIAVDPWKLRADPEGIALIEQVHDSSEWLYPVPHRELLLRLFSLVGIAAELSPAGLLADQIIRSMREREPLEACRVFKIRGVRRLLKELKEGEMISWKDAIATIGREKFDKYKRLYIEARKTPELTPEDVLTFLLKKNILRPKLQLRLWHRLLRKRRDFRCRKCGQKSMISMRAFEGSWRCPYCSQEENLASLIGMEFKHPRAEWVFHKSGFFSKDNNQEGALPVILTLLQLKRSLHATNCIYSTAISLKLSTGKSCETDLVVLAYGRREAIELGIGECKDERGVITEDDVSNLRAVAEHFHHSAIHCFLIFAKTADSFTKDELSLFAGLQSDRLVPVLFSNRELEPYDPYDEYRDEKLPFPYALTLEEMAANSALIYLK